MVIAHNAHESEHLLPVSFCKMHSYLQEEERERKSSAIQIQSVQLLSAVAIAFDGVVDFSECNAGLLIFYLHTHTKYYIVRAYTCTDASVAVANFTKLKYIISPFILWLLFVLYLTQFFVVSNHMSSVKHSSRVCLSLTLTFTVHVGRFYCFCFDSFCSFFLFRLGLFFVLDRTTICHSIYVRFCFCFFLLYFSSDCACSYFSL